MVGNSIYRSQEGAVEAFSVYDRGLRELGVDFGQSYVDTRFGTTHVVEIGPSDAPPLVIFQGGNSISALTLRWFLPLAKHFRIYAPATIGHPGRSAETRVSSSDKSYGLWVTDILDALELSAVPMIGPSFGAGIILRLAAVAPERIERAALLVPSGIINPPVPSLVARLAVPMIWYRLRPGHDRLVAAVSPLFTPGEEVSDLWLESTRVVFEHVTLESDMPRATPASEIAGLSAPVLVLAAEKDILFPGRRVLDRASEIIPNLAGAELLRSSGHVIARQWLPHVNRRLHAFLSR